MAEPTHNRPHTAARPWGWWTVLAVATLLWAAPADSPAQDAGATSEDAEHTEGSSRQTIHFEDLGVVSERGRLVVDYAVADEDWKRLEESDLDLWIQLRVPTDFTYPNDGYSYTLPLDERRSRTEFPRWLTVDTSNDVGLCLLGTGPTDNLVYGRGYTCSAPVWLPIEKSRPPDADTAHTFELQYLAGPPFIPYAPWVEPRVPDFQGPFDQLPAP